MTFRVLGFDQFLLEAVATSTTTPQSWSTIKSPQVIKQLKYLKDNGFLAEEKFTILDDKFSTVYAFNPGYELFKAFPVVTGKQKGDVEEINVTDFVKNNPKVIEDGIKKGLQPKLDIKGTFLSSLALPFLSVIKGFTTVTDVVSSIMKEVDKAYFENPTRLKTTPTGIFRRAGTVEDFFTNGLLTALSEKDYGKRYITFVKLDGKTLAYGFHGTGNPERIKRLEITEKDLKSLNRKMSFGCVNFSEKDIQEINNFITNGQYSIWLSDVTNDIVEIPLKTPAEKMIPRSLVGSQAVKALDKVIKKTP